MIVSAPGLNTTGFVGGLDAISGQRRSAFLKSGTTIPVVASLHRLPLGCHPIGFSGATRFIRIRKGCGSENCAHEIIVRTHALMLRTSFSRRSAIRTQCVPDSFPLFRRVSGRFYLFAGIETMPRCDHALPEEFDSRK